MVLVNLDSQIKFLDIVYKRIPPDLKNFLIDQIPYTESEAKYRIDHFAKPIDSLGIFEDIAISLAAKKMSTNSSIILYRVYLSTII